jgi:hypothetical protein
MASNEHLHIGCGDDYRAGFVNLDQGEVRCDVQHDLNETPYPFANDQFQLIVASQTLEHLDRDRWFDIVAELHRISKPNGLWEFRSPYALSDNYATDPTHRMPLTPRSFDYFDPTKSLGRLGQIYRLQPEVRVLTGELVIADAFGPDVYHRLLVVKPGHPVALPAELPAYLYRHEQPWRRIARRALGMLPPAARARAERLVRGSEK